MKHVRFQDWAIQYKKDNELVKSLKYKPYEDINCFSYVDNSVEGF